MILAREKFGKKLIFLLTIIAFIIAFTNLTNPSNIIIILIMNIIIGGFFYYLLKLFTNKKTAISLSVPIFLIVTLLALKSFDLLNMILVISLSIAIGLLIK